MKNTLLSLLLLSTLLFVSCNDSSPKNEYTLRLNWIPSCSFTGEILGAKEFSAKNNININVNKGGLGLDPIKLVESGEDDFGLCGADLVLSANDKGGDYVIIGVVNYHSQGVFLSKDEKQIYSVDDIYGKRIGELPGGNMQYLYEVFIKKLGLKRGVDFSPVPIPFELKNFIAQDECDVRPVFIYDEPSELELRGIKYNIIEPKDVGVSFKGLVYFCKRELVESNPEIVQAFINTMIEGWQATINDPELGIGALYNYDNSINFEKELIGLKKGISYFSGYEDKILYSDIDSWNDMADSMLELGFLKKKPNFNKIINMNFVNNYYENE